MLGRLPTALLTALSTVLVSALGGAPPTAQPPGAEPPGGLDWAANLNQGHAVDVAYANGALRLAGPSGLLTLPAHPLPRSVGRLSTELDALTPSGSAVEVDVRGRLPGGRWTEWQPSPPGAPTTLPSPSNLVQLRVLLSTAGPTAAGAAAGRPELRGLRVHAEEVPELRVAAPAEPAGYRVFATREGLVHGRTANGHRITPHDLFVALPSWRSLADEDGSEYSVKVCAADSRCVWAPVWDVGPWNTNDDYWSAHREQWRDLPQGVPEAEAAYRDGHNDGRDGTGRTVGNPAGIDLSDGVFDAALKLADNTEVTVSYLWTGGPPLSTVHAEDQQTDTADQLAAAPSTDKSDKSDSDKPDSDKPGDDHGDGLSADRAVPVRGGPSPDAPQVGVAAHNTGVPVECATPSGWLRIGPDQYLPAGAVELADDTSVGPC
ncbi:MAG TPA: hypothetical protein VNP03_19335 [Pseudonocardia sp.]|nr:hypothetical protein [Pseudonocardia sp.]